MPQTGSGDLLADRRFAYAEACLAEGDHVAAAEMAEQALERAPRFAAAWVLLGRAREARHAAGPGDPAAFQAALRAYETARDLDPEDTLGMLVHLARLGGDTGLPVLSPAYLRALFDGYAGRFERHLVEGLGYCGPALLCAALDAYDAAEPPHRALPRHISGLPETCTSPAQGGQARPDRRQDGPRAVEGRHRGEPYPEASLPAPDPLRGPPSPAAGEGKPRVPGSPERSHESRHAPEGAGSAAARYRDAIDLGCGTGLMGAALGDRVATLTGVDIAPAMLALARRKGVYARLVESGIDAFLAAEPAASADLCVAADVFIYVGALDPVLAGVARVLRPGGRAAFTVQSHDGDGVVLGADGRYAHADAHIADAAAQAGLDGPTLRPAAVRRERGLDVPGRTVVVAKPGP